MVECLNHSSFMTDASISAENCNLFEGKAPNHKESIGSPNVRVKLSC